MKEVYTFGGLPLLLALLTDELDGQACEDWKPRLVLHPHQAGVEVDLRSQGRDPKKRSCPHDQQRSDGFVEESLIDVCRLLQDQYIASGSFRGVHLARFIVI